MHAGSATMKKSKKSVQKRGRRGSFAYGAVAVIAATGVIAWILAAQPFGDQTASQTSPIVAGQRAATAAPLPAVEVFKDPSCGCCSLWVEHLRAAGFAVRTTNTSDLIGVKRTHGVPAELQTCHTAVVDGYVIEGHVPPSDVIALLETRPAVAGLGVPGMPVGSPGMEMPGAGVQPYDVYAFDASGVTGVFARHE